MTAPVMKSQAKAGREAKGVEERVALALSRGTLRQWLQFETEAEVAEAKALLVRHKARHVEALTEAQVAARHARALGAVAAAQPARKAESAIIEPPAAEETAKPRPKAAAPAKPRAARKAPPETASPPAAPAPALAAKRERSPGTGGSKPAKRRPPAPILAIAAE